MKILWITNILFPEVEQHLTGNGELKASGGWLLGAAEALIQNDGIELVVASVSFLVKELTKFKGDKIVYYVLPLGKGNTKINLSYVSHWQKIRDEVNPDIIHIHGTEFSHGHAYLKACGNNNVVVSIQGLVSAIAPYYCAGLSSKDILQNLTFKDLIRGSVLHGKQNFKKRGVYEIETIRMAKHIIGRTSWDRARTWAINPNATYHFCNETLRSEFYDGSVWNYNKCLKHSIFLSQASYPIKGLHQVIKALPIILHQYPDAVVRVAGQDITKNDSFMDKIRLSGYGLYIRRLIKKYKLEGKILFTGNLNGEEMKQEYLNSNVFVCPSSIENSPNSLGEAQILGVPCVASYVGGIADMMKGNEDNLYRFEEIEMLAEKICTVFSNKGSQIDMKHVASKRHDGMQNCERLYAIYEKILETQLI